MTLFGLRRFWARWHLIGRARGRQELKIQTFCEMADLGNRLDQADRAHETKKAEEISQKLDELERKLPEYTSLVDGLADIDPNSQDAEEIGSIILKLDELCH